MQGISFIAPFKHLEKGAKSSDFCMVLAHLVLENEAYREFYRKVDRVKLLDNSFFELGYSLSVPAMLEAASLIDADYLVMPDDTLNGLDEFKDAGYKVMAVPSAIPSLEAFLANEEVDRIGLSCLHIPKMCNLPAFNPKARALCINEWVKPKDYWRLHLLGASDDLKEEFRLLKGRFGSIDTSLPIWSGLNNIRLKNRLSKHCDFNTQLEWNNQCDENIGLMKEWFNSSKGCLNV